ncbi:MAG: DUF5647 family protein [Trueperaceae bacterium]
MAIKLPNLCAWIPDEATVIVLPESDPELCAHNLQLVNRQREGQVLLVNLKLERGEREERVHVTPYLQQMRQTYTLPI